MNNSFDKIVLDRKISPYIIPKDSTNKTKDTTGLVRPLPAQGHLVPNALIDPPSVIWQDFKKDVRNVKRGLDGDLNDHDLGRLNGLGMKLGGLSIAAYLATRRVAASQKVMEFLGFGAFFGSMAFWPKLMIEKPIEKLHGINVNQRYVDSQGRKKMFFQDPQYIPWDLWTPEELEKLGDKMGIPRNIPNRQDLIKESAQKTAVQAKTTEIWTAGLATPIGAAMICTGLQPVVDKVASFIDNKTLHHRLMNFETNVDKFKVTINDDKFYKFMMSLNNVPITEELKEKIVLELAPKGLGAYSEQLRKDLERLLVEDSRPRKFTVDEYVEQLFNVPYKPAQEESATTTIAENASSLIKDGRDDLNRYSKEVADLLEDEQLSKETFLDRIKTFEERYPNSDFTKLYKSIEHCDFEKEVVNYTKLDTLNKLVTQTNNNPEQQIKEEIRKFLNSIYSEYKIPIDRYHEIKNEIRKSTTLPEYLKGPLTLAMDELGRERVKPIRFTADVIKKLNEAYKYFSYLDGASNLISKHSSSFVGEHAGSTLAIEWQKTMKGILKHLKFSPEELKTIQLKRPSAENEDVLEELFGKKLRTIALSEDDYNSAVRGLLKNIINFDKALDTKTAAETIDAYDNIMTHAGRYLENLGFRNFTEALIGSKPERHLKDLRYRILDAFGFSKMDYDRTVFVENINSRDAIINHFQYVNADEELRNNLIKRVDALVRDIELEGSTLNISEPKKAKLIQELNAFITGDKNGKLQFYKNPESKSWVLENIFAPQTGSYTDTLKHSFSEKLVGGRFCIYRLFQTLDFEKRAASGLLYKQCAEVLRNADKDKEIKVKPEEVNRIIDLCRHILTSSDITDFSQKFYLRDIDKREFDAIISLLYKLPFDEATQKIIEDYDPYFYDRHRAFKESLLSYINNTKDQFRPDLNSGNPLSSPVSPRRRHFAVAKDLISLISDPVLKNKTSNKWFKIFGTTFVGLTGATLLADAFLCRPNIKPPRQVKLVKRSDFVESLKA